jgi:hypothetical protein
MGNGAAIKHIQVGYFAGANQPVPGPGKIPGHFFNFTDI